MTGRLGAAEERVARVERKLDAAEQIAHIGGFEWNARTNAVTWSDELYRIYGLEPRSCPITLESFVERLHPDDRDRVQGEIRAAIARGGRFAYGERIVRPDGSVRTLETQGEVARDEAGTFLGLVGMCRDVTEEMVERRLQNAEQRVLEMIAEGAPLARTLEELARAIEDRSPPVIASVQLLDLDGVRIRGGAAPSLPEAFSRAIDGAPIGPRAGSCGTAAFTKRPVFVEDIENDPLWVDYRALAREHGLRACWSLPILATDERVLGTFAFYYRERRAPTADDLALATRAIHLARIAIERTQLEDQLRDLSAHVESVREDERTGIAREIHDELGQALTALKMDLAWIGRRAVAPGGLATEALLEKLQAMAQMTDEVINQVRRISAELRPGVLDDLGLAAAIEWQTSEFERRTGITSTLHSSLGDGRFERGLSTAVFRIFQEALTNVARHAGASRIDVSLDVEEGSLRLEVRDDGRGISAEAYKSLHSLGLLGIRERARRLGGVATVLPGSPRGTVVSLVVPMATRSG